MHRFHLYVDDQDKCDLRQDGVEGRIELTWRGQAPLLWLAIIPAHTFDVAKDPFRPRLSGETAAKTLESRRDRVLSVIGERHARTVEHFLSFLRDNSARVVDVYLDDHVSMKRDALDDLKLIVEGFDAPAYRESSLGQRLLGASKTTLNDGWKAYCAYEGTHSFIHRMKSDVPPEELAGASDEATFAWETGEFRL
jgi:hypothetical protein